MLYRAPLFTCRHIYRPVSVARSVLRGFSQLQHVVFADLAPHSRPLCKYCQVNCRSSCTLQLLSCRACTVDVPHRGYKGQTSLVASCGVMRTWMAAARTGNPSVRLSSINPGCNSQEHPWRAPVGLRCIHCSGPYEREFQHQSLERVQSPDQAQARRLEWCGTT